MLRSLKFRQLKDLRKIAIDYNHRNQLLICSKHNFWARFDFSLCPLCCRELREKAYTAQKAGVWEYELNYTNRRSKT